MLTVNQIENKVKLMGFEVDSVYSTSVGANARTTCNKTFKFDVNGIISDSITIKITDGGKYVKGETITLEDIDYRTTTGSKIKIKNREYSVVLWETRDVKAIDYINNKMGSIRLSHSQDSRKETWIHGFEIVK
jgi:hypothetical protein